ncbi:MAG: hypothetical protein H0X15_07555 [Acidobacteria bacterium]|nr:hypothetical protein [Acidobacteriota bacterium]
MQVERNTEFCCRIIIAARFFYPPSSAEFAVRIRFTSTVKDGDISAAVPDIIAEQNRRRRSLSASPLLCQNQRASLRVANVMSDITALVRPRND